MEQKDISTENVAEVHVFFQVGTVLSLLSINCEIAAMSLTWRLLTYLLLEQENLVLLLS